MIRPQSGAYNTHDRMWYRMCPKNTNRNKLSLLVKMKGVLLLSWSLLQVQTLVRVVTQQPVNIPQSLLKCSQEATILDQARRHGAVSE